MKTEDKKWSDYTEEEIKRNKLKYCKKCKYRWESGQMIACAYIVIKHKMRECSPMDCKRFEEGPAIMIGSGEKED